MNLREIVRQLNPSKSASINTALVEEGNILTWINLNTNMYKLSCAQ